VSEAEPELEPEDRNVQVRCCACKTVYVTAIHSFEKQGNRCPGCGSAKAQEQA
jgi:rRNA maturation endonuclease Nob1